MPFRKYIYGFLFFILIYAVGYVRSFIFLRIHYQHWNLSHPDEEPYIHKLYYLLSPFSPNQLYWGKWGLTIFFALVFLLLTCLAIKLIFKKKKFIIWTAYTFTAIITLATISYCTGMLLDNMYHGYNFSLILMHLAQSPVVLMVLIPVFMLAERKI